MKYMNYVFDIDGTICTNTNGDYENAKPYEARIRAINKLYESGHRIYFHTARGMGRTDDSVRMAEALFREMTENQLEEWGVRYHKLFMAKPSGDIYVDDKGINDRKFSWETTNI